MGEVLLFIQFRHMPNNICNVNIFKDEGRKTETRTHCHRVCCLRNEEKLILLFSQLRSKWLREPDEKKKSEKADKHRRQIFLVTCILLLPMSWGCGLREDYLSVKRPQVLQLQAITDWCDRCQNCGNENLIGLGYALSLAGICGTW